MRPLLAGLRCEVTNMYFSIYKYIFPPVTFWIWTTCHYASQHDITNLKTSPLNKLVGATGHSVIRSWTLRLHNLRQSACACIPALSVCHAGFVFVFLSLHIKIINVKNGWWQSLMQEVQGTNCIDYYHGYQGRKAKGTRKLFQSFFNLITDEVERRGHVLENWIIVLGYNWCNVATVKKRLKPLVTLTKNCSGQCQRFKDSVTLI